MIYRKQKASMAKMTAAAIGKFCIALMIIFDLWFVASLAEVMCKNVMPNPHYTDYNFFALVIQHKIK